MLSTKTSLVEASYARPMGPGTEMFPVTVSLRVEKAVTLCPYEFATNNWEVPLSKAIANGTSPTGRVPTTASVASEMTVTSFRLGSEANISPATLSYAKSPTTWSTGIVLTTVSVASEITEMLSTG